MTERLKKLITYLDRSGYFFTSGTILIEKLTIIFVLLK